MADFTHINSQGRAKMVDVSHKEPSVRTAVAKTYVEVSEIIYEKVTRREVQKGDVLAVCQVAGIMAAKKTDEWIPMCHPLPIQSVDIRFRWLKQPRLRLEIVAEVKTKGNTGVEMEALTAVSCTALTFYDMCKSLGKTMTIGPTSLVEKTGGKSGDYRAAPGK